MQAIAAAVAGKTVLSDLFRCSRGRVHIDAAAPVLDAHGNTIAVLVHRSDASAFLYPLLRSWPTPSDSAELILVQQDGNEVVCLNQLTHRPGTALTLRFPISMTDMPAVQAALGKQGRSRGRDYRDKDVLADLRPVGGSPWFMVAKMDADEIHDEAGTRAGTIGLIAFCFILLAAVTTAYFYRRREVGIYQNLFNAEREAEEALRESEERVRKKLDAVMLPDGDIGNLELADIIDTQALQILMKDFFAMENLVTAIVDIHGKVLVATGWQDICTGFHRVHPETLANCRESDTTLSSGVEPGTFKLYKCKNNLWDLATPIIIGGKHMGNLFSGQFLLEDEVPDYEVFRAQAKKYGFNEKEYLAALDRLPRWNRNKIERVMTFFIRFAQLLSDLSYANIKLARTLAEREKMEAQFLQAQKMEAVGRLAGGVAHDFNNMLNVILGYADMALHRLEPSSPIHPYLKEISKAGLRSADLTRQLLAFARKQTIVPKILDLNDTVAGMLNMLMRLIGEDIELLWRPAAVLWPVNLDPAQIDQILANLVVNARDAISGGGRIIIETGTAVFDQAHCDRTAGFVPGRYVMLTVSDDGCGMDKKTLARLFEPFFTTKEVGKGTGLGLATVYGIVKQNSGFITVYSEPGKGTTFRIYLPRCESQEMGTEDTPAAKEAPTGSETVLLVEDEASLLDLGTLILEDLGYTVLAASGPNHALRLAEEHAGEIELLLTDVIMPEMNGSDLRTALAVRRPNLKCLFMSGYTAEVVAHHGVLHGGTHFLQKPFSVEDLAAKLREVLNG